ncbi:MAG: hypothetical protein LQ344_003118 [Seirophora lacunosa]|nr:MAG: hypothetical protein LQ344_003118 [Seirophora lacunosa]
MGEDDPSVPLLSSASSKGTSVASSATKLLADWWLWEAIEASTSIFALSIIAVILFIYDGSALPDWPSVFTINSVISLLSAIGKLCVMAAVGSAINQCKWLWYRQAKSRRLRDLQLFDDASRGPWGAIQLLISLRARHLAFLGALVVVLVNFFDPFLQQVVAYESRSVPSDQTPTIVRSQVYTARSEEGLPLPSLVDLSMKAAIYNGVFDFNENAETGVAHTCSTGRCSWQGFSSLAVCSRCVNLTSYVDKHCTNHKCYALSLPDGPSLTGLGGQINSSVTNISSELHEIEPSILRFTSLISREISDPGSASAVECSMFYCIGKYVATVKEGLVKQRMLASWRNDSARHSDSSDLILRPPNSFTNRANQTVTFNVSHIAAAAINDFMTRKFTGAGGINNSGSIFSSDIVQALYDTSNLTKRINNLAASMTNNIRQQDDHVSDPAQGIAWTNETYVHVRWAWFAFPTTLILISSSFLVGVILETSYRDVMIWKSSTLALLFHGRGLDLSSPSDQPVKRLSSMSTKASSIKAELLETSEGGWRLVQEGQ